MSVLTRSALSSSFNSNLPDNTSGLITPAVLRSELVNIVDSAFLTEDSASIVAEWDGTRTGDSEIIGLLSITGSLTVSGSGTLNNIGPLNQTGDSIFTGNSVFNGNNTINGDVSVTGTGSFGTINYSATTVTGSTVVRSFQVNSGQSVTVNHNFDFDFPFVQVYGIDRVNILADISSSNANTTIVGPFDAVTTGSIIISKMI